MAAVLLASAGPLHAAKFETLGYKAISMGGAAVASSSGSIATYNNPALLGKTHYTAEVSMGGGMGAYDHGAGASIIKLGDSGFLDTINKANQDYTSLTPTDIRNLIDGTEIVIGMDGDAISLTPQAYVAAQLSNFGIGVFGTSDTAAIARVDQAHDQLIFYDAGSGTYIKINSDGTPALSNPTEYADTSIEYALNNGMTYLDVRGVSMAEVPVAYGHNFGSVIGNVMLGGAFKYMQALAYTEKMKIDYSGNLEGPKGERLENTSSGFGVDLGLAYQPAFAYDLTVALVGTNLNSPEFEFPDGTFYTIEPMLRAGLAYSILDSLEIAADIDLTSNKVLNDDLESQMVGGGINFEPFTSVFALSLRAGLMQNLNTNDQAGLIYTAGMGIGLKWFQMDLSGQVGSNTNTSGDVTVPQFAKVNLALISRW